MPTYVIVHAEHRGEDVRLQDDQLTLELTPHWATFRDAAGPCYAVPREHIACIMRVDEPQDGPAPEG